MDKHAMVPKMAAPAVQKMVNDLHYHLQCCQACDHANGILYASHAAEVCELADTIKAIVTPVMFVSPEDEGWVWNGFKVDKVVDIVNNLKTVQNCLKKVEVG